MGEKGKKRGEMISTSEASPAVAWGWGKGGGAWRHAGFWYHALIGQTSSCLQIRGAVGALSMSRSYYSETIQISLLDFAHPSVPRREKNVYL